MELEINNKRPIPKLYAGTTSAKSLPYSKVSDEIDGAIFSTEKTNMLIRIHLKASEDNQWFLESFLYSQSRICSIA